MIQDQIRDAVYEALKAIGVVKMTRNAQTMANQSAQITIEHPTDIAHGDYSTNVALAYAKQLGIPPRAVAEKVIAHLNAELKKKPSKRWGIFSVSSFRKYMSSIEIAGPGFINFKLSPEYFTDQVAEIIKLGDEFGRNDALAGKKIIIDYTNPNPFKIFHIGHLMANAIGESLSRIIEAQGANIIRVNYQGDVGLHVAKAVWGMLQNEADFPKDDASLEDMIHYVNNSYVLGSTSYEGDGKEEIMLINKMLFDRSNPKLMRIYNWGRKVSLLNFEVIYRKLGTKFDQYFYESEVAADGELIVRDFLNRGVFSESDGAVVFKGEQYGLHTRVFITSQGLPTYEAKEVGLTRIKFDKYNPDLSIVVTAIEQDDYFKVVQKALSIMFPYMGEKMKHVSHGMLRLESGKMSSRTGRVITGESLLADVAELVRKKMLGDPAEAKNSSAKNSSIKNKNIAELGETDREQIVIDVSVGAIKYSILKQAMGGDIIYDFNKSISFEGDSGPYLQYSTVRAKAVIAKAKKVNIKGNSRNPLLDTRDHAENVTLLEKMLYRYPEVLARSGESLEPHHIVTYLIELAATFNNFYATTVIIDVKNKKMSEYRVAITEAFVVVMENGLNMIGIRVPARM